MSKPICIRLTYKYETHVDTHLWKVDENQVNFASLAAKASQLLDIPHNRIRLKYKDIDDCIINCSNDEEVVDALELMQDNGCKRFDFEVVVREVAKHDARVAGITAGASSIYINPTKKTPPRAEECPLAPQPTSSAREINVKEKLLATVKVFFGNNCRNNFREPVKLFVNNEEVNDFPSFLLRIKESPLSTDLLRNALLRRPDLVGADVESFGFQLNLDDLHDSDETSFQRNFDVSNEQNSFMIRRAATNSNTPVPSHNSGEEYVMNGEVDNHSSVRPMALEFKGTHHDPTHPHGSHRVNNYDLDVLNQSICRAHDLASVHGYLGNVCIFAVTHDKAWIVWFNREWKGNQQKNILHERMDIFTVAPQDVVSIWAALTCEAVSDPKVFYADANDALMILEFQRSLSPALQGFCRCVAIGASQSRVYAITLPQLAPGRIVVCNSRRKDLALKIYAEDDHALETEIECVESVWSSIEKNQALNSFKDFYALGYIKGDGRLHQFTQDFKNYVQTVKDGIKAGKFGGGDNGYCWWAPIRRASRQAALAATPTLPTSASPGALIMRCGNYKDPLRLNPSKEVRSTALNEAKCWLRLYHDAGIVHRDIRIANIVEFQVGALAYSPTVLPQFPAATPTLRTNWQLIDFSLASLGAEMAEGVLTRIMPGSGQANAAGDTLAKELRFKTEPFYFPWKKEDDVEMAFKLAQNILK